MAEDTRTRQGPACEWRGLAATAAHTHGPDSAAGRRAPAGAGGRPGCALTFWAVTYVLPKPVAVLRYLLSGSRDSGLWRKSHTWKGCGQLWPGAGGGPHTFTLSPSTPKLKFSAGAQARPDLPPTRARPPGAAQREGSLLPLRHLGPQKQRDESALPKRTVCSRRTSAVCTLPSGAHPGPAPPTCLLRPQAVWLSPTGGGRGLGPHMVPQTHVPHEHHSHHQGRLGYTPTQQGHDMLAHCDTGSHCHPTHAQPALQPRLSRRVGGASEPRPPCPPPPCPRSGLSRAFPATPGPSAWSFCPLTTLSPALRCDKDKCTPDPQARCSASWTCSEQPRGTVPWRFHRFGERTED